MLIFFHQNWQYFSEWEHGVTLIKNARKTFVFLRPEVPANYSDMCISTLLKMCHPNWLSLTIDRKIDLNLIYPFKTFTLKLDLFFEKTVLLSLKRRRNSVFGYVMPCVIKINSNTCQKCHTYRIVGKHNNNMLALMQQLYKSECILITYSWKYLLVSKFKYILTLCR